MNANEIETTATPGERLRASGAGWQWTAGEVSIGDTVSHRYEFANVGTEVLRLGKPTRSCGCTDATLSSDVLAPGESCTLDVNIKVNSGAGFQEQTVWIIDDNQPPNKLATASLYMVIRAQQLLWLEPEHIVLGEVSDIDSVHREIWAVLSVGGTGPLPELDAVHWTSPLGFELTVAGAPQDIRTPRGSTRRVPLELTIAKPLPHGDVHDQIMVGAVLGNERSVVPLVVEASGRPELGFEPRDLFMGTIRHDEVVTRSVSLHCRSSPGVTPKFTCSVPWITVKASEPIATAAEAGQPHAYVIVIAPTQSQSFFDAVVTASVGEKECLLRIRGVVN